MKFKSISKLTLLTAFFLGGTCAVWADEAAGSYVYFNDFETVNDKTATASQGAEGKLDATIQGSGSFYDANGVYGKVFKNAGGALRTNYLLLPDDVLAHSYDSKQLTIGFWVNKNNATSSLANGTSLFSAYAAAPTSGTTNKSETGLVNGMPMFICRLGGLLQVNKWGWCNYVAEQNAKGTNTENINWINNDNNWHYYTVVLNGQNAKVYIDGVLMNEWTANTEYKDGDNTMYTSQEGLFTKDGEGNTPLTYICLGGNQSWDWGYTEYGDADPDFMFDDLYITNAALNAWDIQKIIFDKDPSTYITNKKGDLTSIINGDFQSNADGWTGGTFCSWVQTRSWRGTSYSNNHYEKSNDGSMSFTLNNMPAGTYKVVAAARGYNGGIIQPQIAGTTGTSLTCIGDAANNGDMEINTNGVEMPYSALGGFTTDDYGHKWRWITATGTLAADGNLVINFNCTGTSWMAIDDVHLYCTQLGATSYTTTVTEGSAVSNSDGKVVTCDIKLNNPNSIVTSDAAITTAAGATMNNNLVGTNIAQLILYDGADNTFSMTEGDYTINNEYGAAKYYRQLTENTYCTVCLPFTPAIGTGTYYAPTSFENGTLTFAEVADADLKPNTPYILKPSGSYTDLWNNNNGGNSEKYNVKYTGVRPTTSISNEAMWFTGTYEKIANIGSWSGTYYVLGNDNKLHKVAGSVSVNPFRAYFYLSGANAPAFINLNFDGETTGVNMVHDSGLKVQSEYFDLQGRKVANPTKGLYIVNGKKVVIK